MKKLLIAAAIAAPLTLSLGAATPVGLTNVAHAAPITCPGPQEPAKRGGDWVCVNENGNGNTTGAAKTKNPNDRH